MARERRHQRSGRVVDGRGAPLPGALVSIIDSSVPVPEIALMTDAAGRFTLRLPDGRFTFRANAGERSGDARTDGAAVQEEIVIVAREGPA
jgi:hypothetical protein